MGRNAYVDSRQEHSILELSLADDSTRNCLSEGLCKELLDHLRQAVGDGNTRAVILSAHGKCFSSGGDLKAFLETDEPIDDRVGRVLRDVYNPLVRYMREMPLPVIASVQGPAFGAGVSLALCADLVFAAKSVRFSLPFVPRLAAVPDMGTSWLMTKLLGPGRALGFALTGDEISADEAELLGLIWKAVSDEELTATVQVQALKLAGLSPEVVARTKYEINQAVNNTFDAQLELERQLQIACFQGGQVREILSAALERRVPDLTGVSSDVENKLA